MSEDVADQLDGLICAFDKEADGNGADGGVDGGDEGRGGVDGLTNIAGFYVLVTAWVLIGGLVVIASAFVFKRRGAKSRADDGERTLLSATDFGIKTNGQELIVPNKTITVRANIQTIPEKAIQDQEGDRTKQEGCKSESNSTKISAPSCQGEDEPSVQWVDQCFEKIYKDERVVRRLLDSWRRSLNDFVATNEVRPELGKVTVAVLKLLFPHRQDDVSVEFEDLLDHCKAPIVSNVTTQAHPNENIVRPKALKLTHVSRWLFPFHWKFISALVYSPAHARAAPSSPSCRVGRCLPCMKVQNMFRSARYACDLHSTPM